MLKVQDSIQKKQIKSNPHMQEMRLQGSKHHIPGHTILCFGRTIQENLQVDPIHEEL